MEGRNFAAVFSILSWGMLYPVSLYFIGHIFSSGLVPRKWRTSMRKALFFFILASLASLLLVGGMYRIGGFIEKGEVPWGCYSADFWVGCVVVWGIISFVLTLPLIVAISDPPILGLKKRLNVLFAYLILTVYPFLMIIAAGTMIPVIASSLQGIDGSCW